jgi:outer membrane protein assembly factor BamA
VYLWKPINIELYSIDTLPGLDTLFKANPFLRNSFNTGNVIGLGLGAINFTRNRTSSKNRNNSHFIRFGFEESGLLTSVVKELESKVYRFIKLEGEYRFTQKRQKSEFAYRAFAGIGIPLGGQSLPFFKQYFAGGPNSMRAWSLRQLGLGSSLLSDTIPATSFRDRFGDMQLETNLEYRFTIATINGIKIGSALFADIGNVWNLKKDAGNTGAEFSLDRLYKDLAIGVGTGLRVDFSYFLLRLDFAYKVKDPGRVTNEGWMSFKNFTWTEQRQNNNKTEIKNFAFQLGIGLPF